jgi:cyanosortase A-associated protein
MDKISWKPLRVFLLVAIFGSVLMVVGKSIFPSSSTPLETASTEFTFPPSIPLTDWQELESNPLNPNPAINLMAARQYQYQQNNRVLDIEMRYITNSNGDIKTLMERQLNSATVSRPFTLYHQEGVGFYAMAATSERAYLSSCINPRGNSTVTAEQFRDNRNTYDLHVSRLVPWLLGQEELRDFRCLVTLLSIPLEGTSSAQVYPILENAWVSWYAWWQPRFPQP